MFFKKKKEIEKLTNKVEQKDRELLKAEVVLLVVSIIFLLMIAYVATLDISSGIKASLIIISIIAILLVCLYALRIEQVAGYYKCSNCEHKYIPTYKQVLCAMHFGRTRYMKCPECETKSWQKKVLK